MTNFPYVNATGRLETFFNKIQSLGVPNKPVDNEWLASIGFSAKNDRQIKGVLKFIGFITNSKKPMPTERWRIYLGGKQRSKRIMAEGIKQGYSDLFEQYPKAHQCSNEDLRSFFKVKSGKSDGTVTLILATFRKLCSLADFDQISEDDILEDQKESGSVESPTPATEPDPNDDQGKSSQVNPTFSPELNINIQIHISSDAEPNQIDKIFESMAKHLFNQDID